MLDHLVANEQIPDQHAALVSHACERASERECERASERASEREGERVLTWKDTPQRIAHPPRRTQKTAHSSQPRIPRLAGGIHPGFAAREIKRMRPKWGSAYHSPRDRGAQ